ETGHLLDTALLPALFPDEEKQVLKAFHSIMFVTSWEFLTDHVLITKDRNSSLDHKIPNTMELKEKQQEPEPQRMTETTEEAEPRPIKREKAEVCVFQEEGQPLVKEELNTLMVTPVNAEILYHVPELQHMSETKKKPDCVKLKEEQEEPEPAQIKEEQEEPELVQVKEEPEDEEELEMKQEADTLVMTLSHEQTCSELETHENQLLSANSSMAEQQHQQGSNREDLGSVRDIELKLEKRHQDTRNHSDNMNNSETTVCGTNLLPCEVCGKCFNKREGWNLGIGVDGRCEEEEKMQADSDVQTGANVL
ncbi:hypothetical protein CHARACLAT_021322, partial [Characodon lateralis]|nr:hypothetical protein [Characodon lateralis]